MCQGRICSKLVAHMISEKKKIHPKDIKSPKFRSPENAISIAEMADPEN